MIQKAHCYDIFAPTILRIKFLGLLTPSIGPFHFSFTVLIHYRSLTILRFEEGSPVFE